MCTVVAESDPLTAKLVADRLTAGDSPHVVSTAIGRDGLRQALAAQPVDVVLLGCIPGLKRSVDLIRAGHDPPRIIVTELNSIPCDWPGIPDGVDEVVIGATSAEGLAQIVQGMLSDSVRPAPFAAQPGGSLPTAAGQTVTGRRTLKGPAHACSSGLPVPVGRGDRAAVTVATVGFVRRDPAPERPICLRAVSRPWRSAS